MMFRLMETLVTSKTKIHLHSATVAGVDIDTALGDHSMLVSIMSLLHRDPFSFVMMFEAFGFSKGFPCVAETYLSYLRAVCFGRFVRFI